MWIDIPGLSLNVGKVPRFISIHLGKELRAVQILFAQSESWTLSLPRVPFHFLGSSFRRDRSPLRSISTNLRECSVHAHVNALSCVTANATRTLPVPCRDRPCFAQNCEPGGTPGTFVKSPIEAHGGRLWATANVPQGAIFQFEMTAR